jgi:hypothetical protein
VGTATSSRHPWLSSALPFVEIGMAFRETQVVVFEEDGIP